LGERHGGGGQCHEDEDEGESSFHGSDRRGTYFPCLGDVNGIVNLRT